MKISIVIASHNRPNNLLQVLDRIKLSSNRIEEVVVLVEPNSDSIPKLFNADFLNIKFIVNSHKLGTDESILRVIECAKGDWIYFLGDSKLPNHNFIDLFCDVLTYNPDIEAVHFSYDSVIKKDQVVQSIGELIDTGINFGDFILGGNSLISRSLVEDYIANAYRVSSSRVANIAFQLMALSNNRKIYISTKKIIEKFLVKPESYQPGKALLDCWASFNLLTLLPLNRGDSSILNRYIIAFENNKSRWNFFKHTLIFIFRKKIDIAKELRTILSARYIHCNNFFEVLLIRLLLVMNNLSVLLLRKN